MSEKKQKKGMFGQIARLEKFLWVNERQDGHRLKDSSKARNVLHYHCLFRYSCNVDYWLANVRWLNLLQREGFVIYNEKFFEERFNELRNEVQTAIDSQNYSWFNELANKNRMKQWFLDKGSPVKQSIFLQPVDFDKKPIESVTKLSKYITAYISKSPMKKELEKEHVSLIPHWQNYKEAEKGFQSALSKLTTNTVVNDHKKATEEVDYSKIYCRRWACSQGLVTRKETIREAFNAKFGSLIIENSDPATYLKGAVTEEVNEVYNVINPDTGQVYYEVPKFVHSSNSKELIKHFSYDKKDIIKFTVELSRDSKYTLYYYPPQFDRWAQIPEMKKFLQEYFDYNLI